LNYSSWIIAASEPSTLVMRDEWPRPLVFDYAWQTSGNEKFLEQSIKSWHFVQKYIKDNQNGEWKWGIYDDQLTMNNEDKVGIWKCPYHNSRACLEIMKRIDALL